jgi:hypothetical protein
MHGCLFLHIQDSHFIVHESVFKSARNEYTNFQLSSYYYGTQFLVDDGANDVGGFGTGCACKGPLPKADSPESYSDDFACRCAF